MEKLGRVKKGRERPGKVLGKPKKREGKRANLIIPL